MILCIHKEGNKKRYDLCQGCTLYERFRSNAQQCPYLPMLKNGEKCPCIECVVKITCRDACDDFNKYSDKSDKERGRFR